MKISSFFLLLSVLVFGSCSSNRQESSSAPPGQRLMGIWGAQLLNDGDKPAIDFELRIDSTETGYQAFLVNDNEVIPQEFIRLSADSFRIKSLYFDSWIDFTTSDSSLTGVWHNRYRGPEYRMPFRAVRIQENEPELSTFYTEVKWRVVFSPGTEDEEDAIAIFKYSGNGILRGTFLTETGDYRFLKGSWEADTLRLSTFDGSHAYHFEAYSGTGDTLFGMYYSGNHYETNWIAWKDDSFKLRDPYKLTGIVDPYAQFHFSFTNLDGETVSLSDPAYTNKAVVIQLMGSWCPNCMDETKYLKAIYPKLKKNNIELVSLAFEAADKSHAIDLLKRYRKNLDVTWEILYAGNKKKSEAGKSLPQLEHVYSFPTTIYLRRDHTVLAVYTGFNGPGTGKFYDEQTMKLDRTIDALIASSDKR